MFVCLPVIRSLLAQTRPLDAIYLNLPYVTRKGRSYVIGSELESLASQHKRLIINRCNGDDGPITKLLPVLSLEPNPATRIITFDDDVLIHPDTVATLLEASRRHPLAALSFSGWCAGNWPFIYQIVIGSSEDVECDWIQGVHAIMYPRAALDLGEILAFRRSMSTDIARLLLLNDDHWMAGYLERKGIKKIAIATPAREYFTDLFTEAHRSDSISNRREFYGEVFRIGEHFRSLGLYGRSYRISRSVVFPVLCLLVVITATVLVTRPFIRSMPELIFVNLLMAWVVYRIIRRISLERHLLPKILVHTPTN